MWVLFSNRENQIFFLFLKALYVLQAVSVYVSACCSAEECPPETHLSNLWASSEAIQVILSLKYLICCLKSCCECLEAVFSVPMCFWQVQTLLLRLW